MKNAIILIGIMIPFLLRAQINEYTSYPEYNGADLGLSYSSSQTSFRLWAPTADLVQLRLYQEGTGGDPLQTLDMNKADSGTWTIDLAGEMKGLFYTVRVMINNKWLKEIPDPYARAVGVNGKRGLIMDLKETDPDNWQNDKSPVLENATDAVIYELHVRDASISPNSGIYNKGKFSGLTEKGTRNIAGLSTGLDHLADLGVTHIHLLPIYDFYSIDETQPEKPQYNWGYEPLNYNTPEGSYASNACDGLTRINELKQLIKTFHDNNLGVVMDVVYNHTMLTEDSYFNQIVPGYYYRQAPDGTFSNATACGNETASERPMMRNFMLESLKFWVNEYHVDGFRFDLMGVHDITTMNIIARELRKIKPGLLLYGEGWTAGESPLPDSVRALKKYAYKLDDIAVFNDDIRDGIKGSVFVNEERGFASGRPGMEESIKFGIVAACKHPQVDYKKVNYSNAPYAAKPAQTITYAECHDNHVLWDKLKISAIDASEAERKEMYKLALTIVLTSQGISFLHAGSEFLRSKKGNENSYNSGDSINAIDWNLKTRNHDVYLYVKSLIKMRKEHPAFRMKTAEDIVGNLAFLDKMPEGTIGYTINGAAAKDSWKKIRIYFNGTAIPQKIKLDQVSWKSFVSNNQLIAGDSVVNSLELKPYSCSILYF